VERILATTLVAMTLATSVFGCDAVLPDHLRISDCRLATAMANAAARRSAVLKDILERLERSDGRVVVTAHPPTRQATPLLGGLYHTVSVEGNLRVLSIVVFGEVDDAMVAVVGHELRHALEVLELSSARTKTEVDALFNRIGWHTSKGAVETRAAVDAGNAITRELQASKPRASAR
jgi:hypothetical protein